MTVVFVAGDIGAGKSSFCEELSALGAVVISSDELVSEIYAEDAGVIESLEAALGVGLRTASGELDRAKLAEMLFGSSTARASVEAIVHPLVAAKLRSRLAQEAAELIVYEVTALKYTTDTSAADFVCEVVAPAELRLQRLVERGYSADEAKHRIDSQSHDASRRHEVDLVVDNAGDRLQLKAIAQRLFSEWTGSHD